MNILVVGSNGFIGSHVVDRLAARYNVTTVDITPSKRAGHIQIDPEAPDFEAVVRDAGPDVCINCTGAANVSASIAAPSSDFLLNVVRVQQMLEALRRAAPKARFVHLSSAAVYGNPAVIPTPEACPPAPMSPYGWHKLQAELVCQEYASLHGIGTISLRVFSAFGVGLRRQLFWDVWQKSRNNDELTLFGTGDEARDFIFVKDVAAAIEILMLRGDFDGRTVNVADGRMVTIRHAVETLLGAVGWRGKLRFSGVERPGDPARWQADTTRLEALGYRPHYSLEAGVKEIAQWLLAQD